MTKKKNVPPPPESMDAEVPRKLSEDEIQAIARRLATVTIQVRDIERRRRKITRECNEELKELREQQLILAEQCETGYENLRQGDLFADETPGRVGQEDAEAALGEVAARTAGEEPESATACEHGYTGRCSECEGAGEDDSRAPARGLEKVREFQSARDAAAAAGSSSAS